MDAMDGSFRWNRCGARAALVTFSGDGAWDAAAAAANRIHADPFTHVVDATPAFDKLLIEFADRDRYERHIAQAIASLRTEKPSAQAAPRTHRIPVRYDGEDLAHVASHAGLRISEVILLHQTPVYQVTLLGFSPGFPYLEGLPPALHTPRRSMPRPRIPAGSVAIGGSHTGIYSMATAGGWNLIGTTAVRLFDLSQCDGPSGGAAAFLMKTGDHVKFFAE